MSNNSYTAWVSNNQSASVSVANGKKFTSVSAAASASRREFGKGWTVHIITDMGEEVKTFTIRK